MEEIMRKTAGFLKMCCTFVIVLLVIVAVTLAAGFAVIALSPSFSELAAKAGNAITIEGGNLTPAEMDALKPVILGVMGVALVGLVLFIMGTLKTRTALNECKEERPFSRKCAESLKASARLEIIAGLVGIAASLIMNFMAGRLTFGGTPAGSTTVTYSLSFVFYAAEKYLLYHVACYGHSLEKNSAQ